MVRNVRIVITADGMQCVASASVAQHFARFLPKSPLVDKVAWDWEGDVLRVWTVIAHRDIELQRAIYAAESRFLDAFSDRLCDFTVVYREGRRIEDVLPTRAHLLSFVD